MEVCSRVGESRSGILAFSFKSPTVCKFKVLPSNTGYRLLLALIHPPPRSVDHSRRRMNEREERASLVICIPYGIVEYRRYSLQNPRIVTVCTSYANDPGILDLGYRPTHPSVYGESYFLYKRLTCVSVRHAPPTPQVGARVEPSGSASA